MDPSFHWGDGKWMSEVTVAALQLAFSDDVEANIAAVSELVRASCPVSYRAALQQTPVGKP